MRVIGQFDIKRYDREREELMNEYYSNKNKIENNNENKEMHVEIQNPYESSMMEYFKSNVQIRKNGEQVSRGDYYKDYETNHNKIYSNHIPIRPTTEDVEQVDPNKFFGSSLKGIV